MKRKLSDLTNKEVIETLDMLYTATSAVRGRGAVKQFLRDLLTPSERIMLGRRIIIARMLIAGKTYDAIGKRLKVGRTTVSRVERWLHDEFPGYEEALRGVERELTKRKARAEIKYGPFSFAALKRKYPLHFLLFPEPKRKPKAGK